MNDNFKLQVKLKSLAAEARIIRNLEKRRRRAKHKDADGKFIPVMVKVYDPITKRTTKVMSDPVTYWHSRGGGEGREFNSLRNHRIFVVRKEARVSHLAYGFLRGTPYKVMENIAHTKPNWKAVLEIIERFSVDDKRVIWQRFQQWIDESGVESAPINTLLTARLKEAVVNAAYGSTAASLVKVKIMVPASKPSLIKRVPGLG